MMNEKNIKEYLERKLLEISNMVAEQLAEIDNYINNFPEDESKNLKGALKIKTNLISDYKDSYRLKLEINYLQNFLTEQENLKDLNLDLLKEINSLIYVRKFNHSKKFIKLIDDIYLISNNFTWLFFYTDTINEVMEKFFNNLKI